MKYISKSFEETSKIAEEFASTLTPGAVILAKGEMGVGKTAFAKGLGKGFGIKKEITSPTFNIMLVYPCSDFDFVHIDAYRLESPDSIKDFGLDEVLGDEDSICYVEWSQYIQEYITPLKRNVYVVSLKFINDKDREIEIEKIL